MSDPLYPFGFGLSYTTFLIGKAQVSKTVIKNDESIDLTIPVSNTGKLDGTEIVQVYVHKVNDEDGPIKTLRGFKRVYVEAGKTNQITITMPPSAFEFFDRKSQSINAAPGEYELMYGTSSDSKDLHTVKFEIQQSSK